MLTRGFNISLQQVDMYSFGSIQELMQTKFQNLTCSKESPLGFTRYALNTHITTPHFPIVVPEAVF